jgi:hypothetical protein
MAMMTTFTQAMQASFKQVIDSQTANQDKLLKRMQWVAAESAGPEPAPLPDKEVPPLNAADSVPQTSGSGGSSSTSEVQGDKSIVPPSHSQPDSKADASVIDSDDDKEVDSSVRTTRDEHSQRRKVITATLSKNPSFHFETPTGSRLSTEACAMYGLSVLDSVSDVLPVQKGLYDEMRRFAIAKSSKGHKNPERVLRKMYKVPEVQMSHFNAPPSVDESLLHCVDHRRVKYMPKDKQWILNPEHDSGKKEKAMIEDLARQQLLLKISNCLSLSIVASNAMLIQSSALVAQIPELMKNPDFDLHQHLDLLRTSLLNTSHTFAEAQVNSVDMVKLVADSALSLCHDRRKLWTEASTLTKEQIVALNAEPVFTPADPSVQGWPMLGPVVSQKIHHWTEASNSSLSVQANQKVLGLNFQTSRPPANRQPKGKNKGQGQNQGQKGQGKAQTSQPFRGGAESANQGAANSGQSKSAPAKGKPFKKPYRKRQNNKKQ